MGIGRNCVIDRAIIDKNARIADGVVITPEGKPPNFDARQLFHPRRDRGSAEERSDSGRGLDLSEQRDAHYSPPIPPWRVRPVVDGMTAIRRARELLPAESLGADKAAPSNCFESIPGVTVLISSGRWSESTVECDE